MNRLVPFLPQKMLLRDSSKVLSVLMKNREQGSQLFKIAEDLDFETFKKTGLFSYCLQEVENACKNPQSLTSTTERTTCLLAVLINMLEKDKSGEF